MFLLNQEIDHLYSVSISGDTTQNVGQFTKDSIRMKSSLGLAGKAFSSAKLAIEHDATLGGNQLISEEKDLTKLKIDSVKNAIAVPVLDRQNGQPIAVLQIYNYDPDSLKSVHQIEEGEQGPATKQLLWDISTMVSSIMNNLQAL